MTNIILIFPFYVVTTQMLKGKQLFKCISIFTHTFWTRGYTIGQTLYLGMLLIYFEDISRYITEVLREELSIAFIRKNVYIIVQCVYCTSSFSYMSCFMWTLGFMPYAASTALDHSAQNSFFIGWQVTYWTYWWLHSFSHRMLQILFSYDAGHMMN